jgi:single-strand DNA-binding protein
MRDRNSLNKVILIGHLGADPELRYLPQNERAVAHFNLATSEKVFKPDSTENDIRTEWHRIVVWGKTAEFCEKYLTKGKQICLEGKIRTRSWQDRDGNKRYTTEIVAQSIVILGKRDDYEQRPVESPEKAPDFPDQEVSSPEKPGEDDEDIPF